MALEDSIFTPRMPEVDIRADIETIFSKARTAADDLVEDDGGLFHRQVVIVTPGRLLLGDTCPLPGEIHKDELSRLTEILPPKPVKNIAVIGFTQLDALQMDIRQAIPFHGYLLGFASLGHRVWVFEGHASALAAGCRDADLLLVDEGMLAELDKDWRTNAEKAMRGSKIKIIARLVDQ